MTPSVLQKKTKGTKAQITSRVRPGLISATGANQLQHAENESRQC